MIKKVNQHKSIYIILPIYIIKILGVNVLMFLIFKSFLLKNKLKKVKRFIYKFNKKKRGMMTLKVKKIIRYKIEEYPIIKEH